MANWRETNVYPIGTPDITLIFKGLMALCQRSDNGHFELGCFGGEQGHKLTYRINTEALKGEAIEIETGKNLEFFIDNPVGKDDPKVYQSSYGDNRDFSYVIDIEKIHQTPLVKKEINFQHLITVKNGLFYTVKPTTAIFEIRDGGNIQQMAPRAIAFLVGVQIFLNDNQKGILNIEGQPSIEFVKDGSHHIVEFNHECDFEYIPLSPNYKLRNDFYLDYQEIIDSDVQENFLVMVASTMQNVAAGKLNSMRSVSEEEPQGESEGDEEKHTSPCTLRGYGSTNNW